MIRMPPSKDAYDVADQNATRRSISSVVKKLDAADINAANANKLAITNAALAKIAADAAAAAAAVAAAAASDAQSTADGVVTSAGATRVIVDLGLDPTTGRLTSGVDPTADIAGIVAGYVGKAQHGVFLDSFETLPSDWTAQTLTVPLTQGTDGQTGGKTVIARGATYIRFPYNIAFDASKLYRFRCRARMNATAGGVRAFYCGLEGVAADGVTGVRSDNASGFGAPHYVGVGGADLPSDGSWKEFTGWFKGWGAYAASSDATVPSPLAPNTRYFRPVILANWSGAPTTEITEIDYIAIDVLDEDAITRAYTALTHDGDLNRGASGSVAIEALAAAVGADPTNMISNGGGQSGGLGTAAPSWTPYRCAIVPSDTYAKFGDRSLWIANGSPVCSNSYQQFIAKAGDVYQFACWAKAVSVTGDGPAISIYGGSPGNAVAIDRIGYDPGNGAATTVGGSGSYDFVFLSITVRILADCTLTAYVCNCYITAGTGSVYFDGVRLEKIGPNVAIGGYRAVNALDIGNRLVTGVNPNADIAGQPADALAKAQGAGVFTENFSGVNPMANWSVVIGTPNFSIGSAAGFGSGSFGGKCLRAVGPQWFVYNRAIPFDPSKLYKMTARVTVESWGGGAPTTFYAGVIACAADGTILGRDGSTGSYYGQHSFCADANSTPYTSLAWVPYTGWLQGTGTIVQPYPRPDPTAPGYLYSGACYFRPMFIANWTGSSSAVIEIDSIEITEYDPSSISRTYNTINSSNQLTAVNRVPMTAVGGMPARFYQTGTYTPLTTPMTSFGASITISAFDAYFGGSVVHYNAAAAGGYSTPGGTVNYVYGLDPLYAGGSPAWYAHYDPRVVAQQPGLIYLGKITLTDAAGGTGTACVAPQTKILVDNSEQRFAGDIAVGDCLLTQHEVTRLWGRHKVSHVSVHDAERWCLVLNDRRKLIATPNHRVYVEENGWTQLDKLSHGELLDGLYPGIVDKCYRLDNGPVIKLTVEDAHTYQSAGILSHNLKPF